MSKSISTRGKSKVKRSAFVSQQNASPLSWNNSLIFLRKSLDLKDSCKYALTVIYSNGNNLTLASMTKSNFSIQLERAFLQQQYTAALFEEEVESFSFLRMFPDLF